MGNDKYISFAGTPKIAELWTEHKIGSAARATAVAFKLLPKGFNLLDDEPPYALGMVYTSSIEGARILDWLKENLRHGRIEFLDIQMPARGYFYRNSEHDKWKWTDLIENE